MEAYIVDASRTAGGRRDGALKDWHPADHWSFFGQKHNLYPPHCVQGTPGADFLPGLHTQRFQAIWRKGYLPHLDGYSVVAEHPGLAALYRGCGAETVVVCGLTTNICCYYAARDLRRHDLRVLLVEDNRRPYAQYSGYQERPLGDLSDHS